MPQSKEKMFCAAEEKDEKGNYFISTGQLRAYI
jgi:hypothetical protein